MGSRTEKVFVELRRVMNRGGDYYDHLDATKLGRELEPVFDRLLLPQLVYDPIQTCSTPIGFVNLDERFMIS